MRSFGTLAIAALPFVGHAVADHPLYTTSSYQEKAYGLYPNQSYTSSNLSTPIFQVNTAASDKVDPASHVFISPRGTAVGQSAPMMFDSDDLELVWSDPSWKQTFGVRVQEYKNEPYITFWRGSIKSAGYGSGSNIMMNSSYAVVYNITTNNLTVGGDIHEFQLTDNGTALLTAYLPMSYDLTSYGVEDGWIADSIFQEIDVESGDLIFEWRAIDHFSTNDSYADPGATGASSDSPYDYFHINSIEKDDSGNYLISSRHLHMLAYINGTSGDVIWILGGKLNQFEDKSGGNATNFAWQHDARWQTDDLTALTLFDNGASDWESTENATRGLWLTLDYDDMSVTLERAYMSPEDILSVSQGSVQPLSNGNIFMGYGSNAVFTEYSREGDVLWDVQFGIVGNSSVQSYRAYKQNWTGYPSWNPSIASTGNGTDNTTIFMSWNGATEIKSWALLASSSTQDLSNATNLWRNVTKTGFETNTTVGSQYRYIRAAALNAQGEVLGATDVLDVNSGSVTAMTKNVDIGTGSANTTVTTNNSTSSASGTATSTSASSTSSKTSAADVKRASGSVAMGGVLAAVFLLCF
ncbi:hypothetical protein MBLNU459_g1716t1 [Dothideomycetes sp. NU459]